MLYQGFIMPDLFILISFILFVVTSILYLLWNLLKKKSRKKTSNKNKRQAVDEPVDVEIKTLPQRKVTKSQTDEMLDNARQMSKEDPDKVASLIRDWMKAD